MVTQATGGVALRYDGPNNYSWASAGNSGLLEFPFDLDVAGSITVEVRNFHALQPGGADLGNDIFLSMDDSEWSV